MDPTVTVTALRSALPGGVSVLHRRMDAALPQCCNASRLLHHSTRHWSCIQHWIPVQYCTYIQCHAALQHVRSRYVAVRHDRQGMRAWYASCVGSVTKRFVCKVVRTGKGHPPTIPVSGVRACVCESMQYSLCLTLFHPANIHQNISTKSS